MRVKLGSRGTITIPKQLREDLAPQAQFEVVRREDGVIELHPQGRDPSQAWFWTERWQQMEREADEAIAAGRVTRYDDVESFLAALDQIPIGHLDCGFEQCKMPWGPGS